MLSFTATVLFMFIWSCSGEAPCPSKYQTKFCESRRDCQYKAPHSILIAVDGTGSRSWLEQDVGHNQFSSQVGVANNSEWIWKSNVANFFEDYLGESRYFHGPDANEFVAAGNQVHHITESAMFAVCTFLNDQLKYTESTKLSAEYIKTLSMTDQFAIDIVGFSRGGFAAMEISRKLQLVGCRVNDTQIKPVAVRFLGLYDPVQRDIDIGDIFSDEYDNEFIGDNVINVGIAERSEEIGSRSYFGYGVHGFDSHLFPQKKWQRRFLGTHSAVGGYPADSDCEPKEDMPSLWPPTFNMAKYVHFAEAMLCSEQYTDEGDRRAASEVDIWMRRNAVSVGVPITAYHEEYYDGYREYGNH